MADFRESNPLRRFAVFVLGLSDTSYLSLDFEGFRVTGIRGGNRAIYPAAGTTSGRFANRVSLL